MISATNSSHHTRGTYQIQVCANSLSACLLHASPLAHRKEGVFPILLTLTTGSCEGQYSSTNCSLWITGNYKSFKMRLTNGVLRSQFGDNQQIAVCGTVCIQMPLLTRVWSNYTLYTIVSCDIWITTYVQWKWLECIFWKQKAQNAVNVRASHFHYF